MQILIPSTVSAVTISWFSHLPMTASACEVWRSLRHKAGCTFRQSLRLWIRWTRHRSWTWTEPYSFVIVLGHGQTPILSNMPLHKLDVTARLLLWKHEWRICETMQSSHRLSPTMALVRAFLAPTASDDGAGAHFCESLPSSPPRCVALPWKHLTNFRKANFFNLFFSWNTQFKVMTCKNREWYRTFCAFLIHNKRSKGTLTNLSSINLVFIFRCSSSPRNPVYSRHVDFSTLGFSLSLHRHSYI